MKITRVEIDGFGVWRGLALGDLSERITVFYGANEAGKTTLMQFIRSVLYGLSANRRQRYLSVLGGQTAGGRLEVDGIHGMLYIERTVLPGDDGAGGGEGVLTVTAADGTIHNDYLLHDWLQGVDERTFNNVFAVGLRELQELGTLSDTDAAAWLYNLTAGVDRVSIVQIIRELEAWRRRFLSTRPEKSDIGQLLQEKDALSAEIDKLSSQTGQWVQLAEKRRQSFEESLRLEDEIRQLENRARTIEIATSIRQKWLERADVERQLGTLKRPTGVAEGARERLGRLNERIEEKRQRQNALRDRWRRLRDQARRLGIRRGLWRHASRLEALGEQQQWITSLESQTEQAETEVRQLESQLNDKRRATGCEAGSLEAARVTISPQSLAGLRNPARSLRRARGRQRALRLKAEASTQTAERLQQEIRTALGSRPDRDLAAALDEVGGQVAQLRRRVQLEERLDQAGRHQQELEEQGRHFVQQEPVPMWVFAALGGVFAVGIVLVLASLFVSTAVVASLGVTLAVLGVVGAGTAMGAKLLWERSNAKQLQQCQRQMEVLDKQVELLKQERDALDARLATGGGPLAVRLQTAEGKLAKLESLLPVEARRQAAEQDAAAARQQEQDAAAEVAAAKRVWRAALQTARIPTHLRPKQVKAMAHSGQEIVELERQLESRRADARQRRADLAAALSRVDSLADAAGLALLGETAGDRLRYLMRELAHQRTAIARREELRVQARRLKAKAARCRQTLVRLQAKRQALFGRAGVNSESEYRRLVELADHLQSLEVQREALRHEIAAALGADASEESLQPFLDADQADRLEKEWDSTIAQLEQSELRLKQTLQQQGALDAQRQRLAEDRTLAEKQLDLAALECRLQEAIERWQVLAVTETLLREVRDEYEQHRQPETLVEASTYMRKLTDGRYTRIWTPLGEDVLYVADRDGASLPVEVLSRGTREQLFLSLRLALVAMYERRGVHLPVVLDDVLVNFDSARAKAAAGVLRDFAKQGHQVLVFTCHEHVWKMFKSMRIDARRLPNHTELAAARIVRKPVARLAAALGDETLPLLSIEEDEQENAADLETAAIEEEAAVLQSSVEQPAEEVEEEELAEMDEISDDESNVDELEYEDGEECDYEDEVASEDEDEEVEEDEEELDEAEVDDEYEEEEDEYEDDEEEDEELDEEGDEEEYEEDEEEYEEDDDEEYEYEEDEAEEAEGEDEDLADEDEEDEGEEEAEDEYEEDEDCEQEWSEDDVEEADEESEDTELDDDDEDDDEGNKSAEAA